MLELGVLSGLLLVLNAKVKVIEVRHVLILFLEAVNIVQKQKWLTARRRMDFFLAMILYE